MKRRNSGDNYTSYKIGALTLTSLRDGYVDMPITRLRQPGNKVFGDELPQQVRLVDGNLRLSVNAFSLDDGTNVTLIDTGASNAWLASMGLLPEALREANIAVNRIRTIAFTHTHIDHINGLILPNGQALNCLACSYPRKSSTCSALRRGSNAFMNAQKHSRPGNVLAPVLKL